MWWGADRGKKISGIIEKKLPLKSQNEKQKIYNDLSQPNMTGPWPQEVLYNPNVR
jgi:hypothetical protein